LGETRELDEIDERLGACPNNGRMALV
jgi:hypothetical protein